MKKTNKFPFREDGSMMSAEEISESLKHGPLNESTKDFHPVQTKLSEQDLRAMGYVTTEDLKKELNW